MKLKPAIPAIDERVYIDPTTLEDSDPETSDDISALPVHPDDIAVSRRPSNSSPKLERIVTDTTEDEDLHDEMFLERLPTGSSMAVD
jgi:hypothetical protein